MKYRLLKFLDVTGLTVLIPVVRLCSGEEPRVQLRKIWQSIVIPMLAVIAFVLLWGQLAPRHKTKSGEVPTPSVVWTATQGIWQFHDREKTKELAYELEGQTRERQLAVVQRRIAQTAQRLRAADEALSSAETERLEWLSNRIAPLQQQLDELNAAAAVDARTRADAINSLAAAVQPGDDAGHRELLQEIRKDVAASEAAAQQASNLRSQIDDVRADSYAPLTAARLQQTQIAEELQFLQKIADQLQHANRETRVASAAQRVQADAAAFTAATGAKAVELGTRVVQGEQRVETARDAAYARPWTLPDQIKRSLACVFFGFMLGTLIAVPIGILCGLSPTFMAAMTPFIALFKPVSPIVWLPIALIIVGGFIPDPDKHWLMTMLADLPLIGRLKINPAFIASGVTVALCSLWPTLVNTALGVASIEKDHMNVARVLRLPFWTRMYRIVIPSSLPLIFAGLRISLGVGWMVLIAAELLSSSEGLGKFIWDQFNNGASDSFAKMVAVVFIVGVIGFLLDRIMIVLQRLVSFDTAAATV